MYDEDYLVLKEYSFIIKNFSYNCEIYIVWNC